MAVRYGILRPLVVWNVQWEGDNIDEIKTLFGPDMAPYFFVNEDTGALCYGVTLDEANQYELGSWLSPMGGLWEMSDIEWARSYQEVDTNASVVYDVSIAE